MRDHVRFHSTKFTPADVEPGQINTDRYGYALAAWIGARLEERGFAPDSPTPDDWGWLVGLVHDGRVVRIGCGNVDGSVSEWLVFVEAAGPGIMARLLGRARDGAPNAKYGIVAAIHGALEASPDVREIEWFRVGNRGAETDHATTPI